MQIGTVHNLGQNFAKTFELEFETPDGEKDFVYQTCYGISDRAIASLISVHGDEKGLVIPVDVAPIQIVLIPLLFKGKEEIVMDKIKELNNTLKSEFRVHLDDRDIRPGRKYNDWELKGVPLRIELGPRDIENGHALIVRRDTGEKITVEYSNILEEVEKIVSMYKENLKLKAEEKVKSFITVLDFENDVNSLSEKVKAKLLENKGIILIPFNESIYNEEFEELIDASVLGLTTYEGKEYISVARTY
jgi:prolyl-tRNA synthetase